MQNILTFGRSGLNKFNGVLPSISVKFKFILLNFKMYNNIVSFFIGSQKGGLVCANGTCVIQPDFKNGFKITSKLIF